MWRCNCRGGLVFLQGDGSLSSSLQAIVSNWTIGPYNGQIFSYIFGGGELQGSYTWMAAFAQSGTLNFLGSIVTAPFTFGP